MLKNGRDFPVIRVSLLLLFTYFGMAKATWAENLDDLNTYKSCGKSENSRALAKQIIEDDNQQRSTLTCNSLLSEIAQKKAEEMAMEGVVSHHGPGGTPDQRLIDAGYQLKIPKDTMNFNHVEAVIGGFSSSEEVLDNFKNSFHHRVHLFAEHEFFLQQDEIGVGYAYNWDSPHVDYWVVYIASEKPFYAEESSNITEQAQ